MKNIDTLLESVDLNNSKSRIYKNTELLLKQYGKVLWRLESELNDMNEMIASEYNTDLYTYIDSLVDVDISIQKNRLQDRLTSLENSKSLIVLIDQAVTMLYNYPSEGNLYFDILSKAYLSFYKNTGEDISEVLDLSLRTYYRKKKTAINLLGIILWGFLLPSVKNDGSKLAVEWQ